MNEIVILYFIVGFFVAHTCFLSWKLWGYRQAIIQLQRDIWERGGVVEVLTEPAPQAHERFAPLNPQMPSETTRLLRGVR